jgi:hypothetical protein
MNINRTTLNNLVQYAKFFSIGIILAAALYVTSPSWLPYIQRDPYIGSDKAAVAGAEAYFTINAEAGFETWLKRVCDVSTQAGCDLTRTIAETNGMWQQVESQKTNRKVKAQALAMVDTAKGGTTAAVWKVKLSEISGDKTTEIFVAVAKEDETWKFERFLMKQETERYTGQESK